MTINEFFKDRTGLATPDFVYPTKFKHPRPKDLCSLFFSKGECISTAINEETFNLGVGDGQPLFSASHSHVSVAPKSLSNILTGSPALSMYSLRAAISQLHEFYSAPDTLITGSDSYMCQKARILIAELEVGLGWKLEHMVIPQLRDPMEKYRWFVADSRKATGHYKKLKMGYSELCVYTWDWIVASLSTTCPTL